MTYTTPCKQTLKKPCLGWQATTMLNLGSEGEQDKKKDAFQIGLYWALTVNKFITDAPHSECGEMSAGNCYCQDKSIGAICLQRLTAS